jgi:glycosyltransferase involved in cell wall biosynthesis
MEISLDNGSGQYLEASAPLMDKLAMQRPLRVVQVNTRDHRGGAERVVWNLHQAYRRRGINTWLAVGRKFSDDPGVVTIPNAEAKSLNTKVLHKAVSWLQTLRGFREKPLVNMLLWIAQPRRQKDIRRGIEDFHYPGTWRLFQLFSEIPDIIHCHNLHGDYFDLRSLAWLSQQCPVILTLHDAWLITGHCAHSFACERWKTGCGQCPGLSIYPGIKRDSTEYNWQRKQGIYAQSRFYAATPSRWLMQKTKQSMLAPSVNEWRVIPNGVDLSVFHPADKKTIREKLGISSDARVLLFIARGVRKNIWKDYETMRAALGLIVNRMRVKELLFIALGEDGPPEKIGKADLRFFPYQNDSEAVARYYQAADVYLHPAKVDTFPNTVLEALACGTPVVGTAVGGIPEQVKSLKPGGWNPEYPTYGTDAATGILVPSEDAEAMAGSVVDLLRDEPLRFRLGENGARDARRRFDLTRQVEEYLGWYYEIAQRWKAERSNSRTVEEEVPVGPTLGRISPVV